MPRKNTDPYASANKLSAHYRRLLAARPALENEIADLEKKVRDAFPELVTKRAALYEMDATMAECLRMVESEVSRLADSIPQKAKA